VAAERRRSSPPAERAAPSQARAFWSGTISFGLVSVPVDLFAAVRPRRVPLRMLGPDGHLLSRRYVCPRHGTFLDSDEIVRGHRTADGSYIVVSDAELQRLEPRKSRDIDLSRFVPRHEIDPLLVDRPYILVPAGQSSKAYHLLAETMERIERAGIATFVMRGREYLVAIFAEQGLLWAQTLRFTDEVRTPEDVGLPEVRAASAERRRAMRAAIEALERDQLDEDLLHDQDSGQIMGLAQRKRAEGRDVVIVPEVAPEEEETDNVIDIMSVLKERVGAARLSTKKRDAKARVADGTADGLERKSKLEIYERAKKLGIRGRSSMSKDELVAAIRANT
jgi:DNA end-binding protein Ku